METCGVFVEGSATHYARLKQTKDAVEVLLTKEHPEAEMKIVSGLDSDEIILRKLTLKLRNRFAIRKVLPFQAESLLPYALEETILLPFFKRKASDTDVLLIASTKTHLQNHLNKLQAFHIDPDSVSCLPAAIHRFVRHFFPEYSELFFLHVGEEKSFCGLIMEGMLQQIYAFSSADPLHMQKELDRAFAFLKKRAPSTIDRLLVTGKPLSTAEQSSWGLALIDKPGFPQRFLEHAIPIGLALEGLSQDEHAVEFRQKECKKRTLAYYFSCGLLALISAIGGSLLVKYEERKLEERLLALHLIKDEMPTNVDEAVTLCENALSNEKKPYPIVSNVPKVSDLLAWLSGHPLLTDEIDVKEVHYQLTKYPKLGVSQEPYQAKVDLKFTASSPTAARQFREALTKGDELVNPKPEITWNVQQNLYETSFFLRRTPK